jgi:hypothetical protein
MLGLLSSSTDPSHRLRPDGTAVPTTRGGLGEHGLGAGERALGIDERARLPERGEERRERFRSGEMRVGTEELQLARRVCRGKLGQPQPAEQLRANPHGQAEVGLA